MRIAVRTLAVTSALALGATACAGASASDGDDVVASLQVDDTHDLVIMRIPDDDHSDTMRVCLTGHGEKAAPDTDPCPPFAPRGGGPTALGASLVTDADAQVSELVVVTHDQAGFRTAVPGPMAIAAPVDITLPPGLTFTAIPMRIHVGRSEQSVDRLIGCFDTGLAGLERAVLITSVPAADTGVPAAGPLQASAGTLASDTCLR
ncbi:MAG: hypothetical protein ACE5GB_07465 [Acidimicrobiales bacterium]